MSMYQQTKNNTGYVALISVLITSALTLAIVIGASMRSIGGGQAGVLLHNTQQARALVDMCVDQALFYLQEDLEYQGNDDIIVSEGSCHIGVIQGSGNTDRIILVDSNVHGSVKKVSVHVSLVTPVIHISSWREVTEF